MVSLKEKRTKSRKKRINPFVKLLIAVLVLAGLFFFLNSPIFTVDKFTVKGNAYYLNEEILTMGNCKTGGNIFWGTDCSDIKARLEKDAYMSDVKVRRVLPDTISIELSERKQIGAIVYGEKYVVIDANGTVLRKTEVDPKVTVLSGLTISKLEVGEVIEVEEKVLFRQVLELLNESDRNGMFFKRISIGEVDDEGLHLGQPYVHGDSGAYYGSCKRGQIANIHGGTFDRKIERGISKNKRRQQYLIYAENRLIFG